jgi:hypothetical protein
MLIRLRRMTMQIVFHVSSLISRTKGIVVLSLFACCVDVANGQEKTFHLGEQASKEIAFSPDGERVALSAFDAVLNEKKIILFDLKKEKVIGVCWDGPHAYFQGLAFSKDGKTVISYSPRNINGDLYSVIKFWDLERGVEKKQSMLAHGQGFLITDRYHVTRLSPDWTLVKVFDLVTEKEIVLNGDHTSRVEKASASGDGKYLATAERDGPVKVWSLPDGKERFNVKPGATPVFRMSFVQQGTTLVVVNPGTSFYEVSSGKVREKNPSFHAYDVSPDGKMMVCKREVAIFNEKEDKYTRYPDAVNVYSRAKNDVIATYKIDTRWQLQHLVFSPTGQRIIAAGGGVLRVWDISKLQP